MNGDPSAAEPPRGPTTGAEQARYALVSQHFEELRGLDDDERSARLAILSEADAELAAEVEDLLGETGEQAGDAFDQTAIARGPPTLATAVLQLPPLPESIGPFRIVRLVGRGGMGVVYEAEQDEPRRRVALKLVNPGLAHGERLARLRREAEAMGRLQHPGIAQVFATGSVDLGGGEQPYVVMELVAGQSLTVHAEGSSLDVAARVELVASLCDAVQHAHDRGVIHRDLKPDNVLVDERGRPRVLDFGVARLATGGDPALQTVRTETGVLVGTLTHMAPEQLLGDPSRIGPLVDVYALGVIAFQLLAGRLPHDVSGLPATTAVQRLLTADAPRLGSLVAGLDVDLETVVGKALEADPARRYVSAAAFGADLRRILAHEPISARAPSALYRARRFTRRHRGLTWGVATAMVALVVGALLALQYAWEADARRGEAELAQYRSTLVAASARLDEPATELDRALLLEAPAHLRGWEWGHLWARRAEPGRPLHDHWVQLAALARCDDGPCVATLTIFDDGRPSEFALIGIPDGRTLLRRETSMWRFAFNGSWCTWFDLEGRLLGAELPDGDPELLLETVDASTDTVGLSRDGRHAAVLQPGPPGGTQVAVHALESAAVRAIAVPDGASSPRLGGSGDRLIVLADGQARMYAVPGGELLLEVPAEDAAFDLSSDHLVTRSVDSTVSIWDTRPVSDALVHRELRTVAEQAVAVHTGRGLVAMADTSGQLTVAPLGRPEDQVVLGSVATDPWTRVLWLPEGDRLVTSGAFGLRLWEVDLADRGVFARHASFAYCVAAEDGQGLLATAGWDGWAGEPGGVRVHDLATGAERWRSGDEAPGAPRALCWVGDDLLLASGNQPSKLVAYDPGSGAVRWSLPAAMEALAVEPGARAAPARFAAHSVSARLSMHAVDDGRELWSRAIMPASGDEAARHHALDWSPDGERLAVTAVSREVVLVAADDGRELTRWHASCAPIGYVVDLAFSPDGTLLATASDEGHVHLWDARTGAPQGEPLGHKAPPLCVAFHPDGTRLVVGLRDGSIPVWDLTDGTRLAVLEGHGADDGASTYVRQLGWADGGRTLYSASGDGTVRRWPSAWPEEG